MTTPLSDTVSGGAGYGVGDAREHTPESRDRASKGALSLAQQRTPWAALVKPRVVDVAPSGEPVPACPSPTLRERIEQALAHAVRKPFAKKVRTSSHTAREVAIDNQ